MSDRRNVRYPTYIVVGLVVVTLPLWARWFGDGETVARWTALALQVWGFGLVSWDLRLIAKEMGHPGFRDWLAGFLPKRPPKPVFAEASFKIEASASAKAHGGVSPDSPIEARVSHIEKVQLEILADIERVRREVHTATLAVKEEGQQGLARVESAVFGLKGDLQKTALRAFHLEAMGVVLFGLGSILSTVPEFVTHYLDMVWQTVL